MHRKLKTNVMTRLYIVAVKRKDTGAERRYFVTAESAEAAKLRVDPALFEVLEAHIATKEGRNPYGRKS